MQAIRHIECTEQNSINVTIPSEWRGRRLEIIILPLEESPVNDVTSSQETSVSLADQLMDIGKRCAALPVLDEQSAEEILGYDEHGLPT